jgi:hypothetical protein
MQIDMIKELHQISGSLNSLIAIEQDDVANGILCDAYDNIGAALKRLNEKVYAEFQDDTPPNAPPVPMNRYHGEKHHGDLILLAEDRSGSHDSPPVPRG